MNKNAFETTKLAKGEVNVYDFGNVKLHAYKTNDFIDDEVLSSKKTARLLSLNPHASLTTTRSLPSILKLSRLREFSLLITAQAQLSFLIFRSMQPRTLSTIQKPAAAKL